MKKIRKIDWFLIFFLLILALIVRLYKITTPLADYHSWRQADTAAVARNYVKEKKIDLLHPKYDDLSKIQSGRENPVGYRMVEFPLYQALIAKIYLIFPFFSIEVYGRLISIFFTLLSLVTLYFLLLFSSSRIAAFFAGFTFALTPFMIFFTRVVLPEPMAMSLALMAVFFLYVYSEVKERKLISYFWYILSLICFALAVLVKPSALFYFFPLIFLFFKIHRLDFFKKIEVYFYFLLSLLPLIFWRVYIQQFPEGIPANEWLFTSVNTPDGLKNIFFRPSFFRWIFFERINNLIFGGYLTFFFILGILIKRKNYFLYSFLFTLFFYLFIFQGGNVQHEYYQTIIFPILSLFVGLGIESLLTTKKLFINRFFLINFVIFIYLFSFYFSYTKVKNFYSVSFSLVNFASIIRSLTKEEDLILTDTTGDTTLLYLSNRRGYPAVYQDIDYFKKLGVKYFVTDKKWVIEEVIKKQKLPVVFFNDQFAIFAL